MRSTNLQPQKHTEVYVDANVGQAMGVGIAVSEDEGTMVEYYRFGSKMQTGQAGKMAVLITLKKYENVERNLILHTDRLELANKLRQRNLNTNLDIWMAIEARWDRGMTTKVAWIRRTDKTQVIAYRAAQQAEKPGGINLDGRRWEFKKKSEIKMERGEEILRLWHID